MNKALHDVLQNMRDGVVPPHSDDSEIVKAYGKAVEDALSDDVDPGATVFDAILAGLRAMCQCYIHCAVHGEYHADMDPHVVLRFAGLLAKAHENELKEAETASAGIPAVCVRGPASMKAMAHALDVISREITVSGNSAKTGLSLFDIKRLCDDALNEPARPIDMFEDWQPIWEYWVANIATSDDDKHCNEPFLKWLFHKEEKDE